MSVTETSKDQEPEPVVAGHRAPWPAVIVTLVMLVIGFATSIMIYPIAAVVVGIPSLLILTSGRLRRTLHIRRPWRSLPVLGLLAPRGLAGLGIVWAATSSVTGYATYSAGGAWEENGLIFTTLTGSPFDPRKIYRPFFAALATAGLPRIRPHDLRHSCATLHMRNGVPGPLVQRWLGHSSIALTLGTYSHVSPDMLDDAAKRMDGVFERSVV